MILRPLSLLLLSGLFLIVSCSQSSSSKTSPPCLTEMPAAIDTAIIAALGAHPDTAGVVVAIYHPDLGYVHKAYGLESRASSSPMREDHIFDIGSVMKNFRWVIMHKLISEGLLNLTDPVNNYVASPVLPGRTIKHLMHHSTGMIDIPESTYMADAMMNLTRTYTYNEMIAFLFGSTAADYTNGIANVFTVGTDHRYSSFGPLIAQEVSGSLTGQEMRDLIGSRILDPLEMTNTSFISYDARPENLAQGYDDAVTEMNAMNDYRDTRAFSSGFGGLMYSSACDLARFTNNEFNNNSFLSSSTVTSMTSDTIMSGGVEVGLGVFKYPTWGNFWGHLGSSIHGHSSAIAHRKTDKLSIVVLSNIDEAHDNFGTHFSVISAIGGVL